MKPTTLVLAAAVAASLVHTDLSAGAPLVCWKVETGHAASLPWTDDPSAYDGAKPGYDTRRLAADTLALLGPDVPVLARMETLRRAALYGAKDRDAGDALLKRLTERARTSKGRAQALALFDAGYLVETGKQAEGTWSRVLKATGLRTGPEDLGASGYAWVARAIQLDRGSAEMEYAAALITAHPRRSEHDGHLARAAAAARPGSPLAANLLRNFGDRAGAIRELARLGGPPR